ncbi:hypothetical protein DICPUDRAFT_80492 [Dictyostelium purpureum]|uniref:EGF-like domain-containing protein n=1 Tax=Dictyostelium purpureum TaxID=5786 RepID=F0ZQM4_DICPU|nr:uncharacterized protein DICPUDRAFT_80492 [Dictyostelium purpureum]EGC33752.1 hypothetical protein DICPUDRAFT_80492 [Dictyostelium purpureum]|eukprot:XP_003289718.1 hypothetical protein DICPUDRAFT_80492 [Dictyostelium purpureum]
MDLTTKLGQLMQPPEGPIDFCLEKYFLCSNDDTITQFYYPQTTDQLIQYTDVDCIKPLEVFEIVEWNLHENFFNFSTTHFQINIIANQNLNIHFPIKAYTLKIVLNSKIEKEILLSNLYLPLQSYVNIYPNNDPKNYDISVYLNNDLVTNPKFPLRVGGAILYTRNIPSVKNFYSGSTFTYYISNDFDYNSFQNLSTHNAIYSIEIKGASHPMIPVSILLNLNKSSIYNSFLNSLTIGYDVLAPSSLIDFSGSTVIKSLTIKNTKKFNYNNQFPFSKLPKGIFYFTYSFGLLNDVPNYKIFEKTDMYIFNLNYNRITGTLPKWDGSNNSIYILDFQNNYITGTIDDSYCSVYLNIRNNSMTGKIPDCYTCHFRDLSFKLSFSQNSFNNYDTVTTCKTIPKLKYFNQITWNGTMFITAPTLSLMGQNLGYILSSIQSNPIIMFDYIKKVNSIINAAYYIPDRTIHEFNFISTGQEFTLTPDPYPPLLSNITSNNHILVFKGLYYSYDITEITITIGDKSCDVTDSTFYQITCTLTTYPNQLNNVSGTLKVDQLQTTFNLNLDNNDGNEVFNNYTSCPDNCESYNGNNCNYNTGICECTSYWIGENCFTPNHYVSSITPTYEDGGLVTMNGWFGDIHKDLKVTIGNQECKIDTISSNTITCNIGAGTGKKDVIVYQNGITWKSFNFFIYQSKQQTCLNNCTDTNHGICNTSNGICECKSGWTGFDCNSPSNNNNNNNGNTNSTVNPDGSTTINNDQTTYNILITSLLELDINSDTVKQYPLQNNWNVTSNDKNGSNVTFTQILNETECQIVLSIQEIENDIQYSFAGLEFKLDKGSIKVSVSIHNYNYQSPLNTLQLQMISNVSDTTSNDCNSKSASTSTSILDNQTLNYISINKDNKILYGRFINRAISDGHTTLITTSLISNQNESVTIGINIPHCKTSCYIDPDFSVIISPDFKSSCNNKSKKYIIPVAIFASCIGLAAIITAVYFYLKMISRKKFEKKLIKLNSLIK